MDIENIQWEREDACKNTEHGTVKSVKKNENENAIEGRKEGKKGRRRRIKERREV
jgi:hypothetical protein